MNKTEVYLTEEPRDIPLPADLCSEWSNSVDVERRTLLTPQCLDHKRSPLRAEIKQSEEQSSPKIPKKNQTNQRRWLDIFSSILSFA